MKEFRTGLFEDKKLNLKKHFFRLEDIVGDLPSNVLSRPGTPDVWNFDEKEISLKVAPPRPTSATLCSPPVPRKVPISVDHKLRK